MASSSGSTPSLERVIGEAFCAASKIILESRIYAPMPKAQQDQAKGRAWFNLEVEELEGASKQLERWRRETGLPLVLEVFLQPWGGVHGSQQDKAETLLERWVVHYYPMLPEGPSHLSRSQLSRLNPSSVYKRLVITLRSLYTYVRVLPAYRMFRACKRQHGSNFTLGYRLHSTLPGAAAAAPHGARRMQSFRFGAVDTPYGQLRIGVDYQPASTVTILEQTTSPQPLPQIIADYVGSPSATAGRGRRTSAPPQLRHAASASACGYEPGPSPPTPTYHWSTSMRSASPHRTLSSHSSEVSSPLSAHDTLPCSSAPHTVSLPAMLQALSTPTGKYTASSPIGRPPLSKPPRATTAVIAAAPGRGHSTAGGQGLLGSSPLSAGGQGPAAGAAGEGKDEEECERGSPCGSAGSSARQSSAPVSIPGRGGLGSGQPGYGAAGRRLRSSGDLWALQQAANMHKPLSAPAVSHMQAPQGAAAAATAGAPAGSTHPARSGRGAGPMMEPFPSPPPARLPPMHGGTLDSESSSSAASSLYPTSCSPQLPFAFTPSAQSLASFGARGGMQESLVRLERVSPRLGRTLSGTSGGGTSVPHAVTVTQLRLGSGAGGAAGFSPSSGGSGGGVTGREVPANTALIRRPSWSSRSSVYHQLSGEASQQGVGYSVSPMQDAALESMLAGSTPRQFALATDGLPSPMTAAQPVGGALLPGSSGPISRAGSTVSGVSAVPPMLTLPSASPELSGVLDEADVLPFALDEASGALSLKSRSPAAASQLLGPSSITSPDQLPFSTPVGGTGSPLGATAEQSVQAAGSSAAARAAAAAPMPVSPSAVPGPSVSPSVVDTDAAIGAFVRLIQEAPPLRMHAARLTGRAASADLPAVAGLPAPVPGTSSGSDSSGATCLSDVRGQTLQAGLRQFSRIKERLQQRGVLAGPAEA